MNRSFFVSVSSPSFVSAAVATPAFHPRQRATLGATDSPRARCLHNARLSGTHTEGLLSSSRERARTFPPRTKKHPLFFPFLPWFSARTPSLVFSTASRACTRTRASRAPQSVSEKSLHFFTHLAYFTIAQRIKGEYFIIFSFTSLVPWLHPESEEFSSRVFAKNRHQSRRNREEQNGESKREGKKQKPSPLNSSRSTFCDRSVKR